MSYQPRALLIAGVILLAVGSVHAEDASSEMKQAGKSIADGAKKFGDAVAEGSKELGREIRDSKATKAVVDTSKDVGQATSEGAKTAWYKTRDWTTQTSKRVADATVRWWDEAIRGKEKTRDDLRRENEALKAKNDGKAP